MKLDARRRRLVARLASRGHHVQAQSTLREWQEAGKRRDNRFSYIVVYNSHSAARRSDWRNIFIDMIQTLIVC